MLTFKIQECGEVCCVHSLNIEGAEGRSPFLRRWPVYGHPRHGTQLWNTPVLLSNTDLAALTVVQDQPCCRLQQTKVYCKASQVENQQASDKKEACLLIQISAQLLLIAVDVLQTQIADVIHSGAHSNGFCYGWCARLEPGRGRRIRRMIQEDILHQAQDIAQYMTLLHLSNLPWQSSGGSQSQLQGVASGSKAHGQCVGKCHSPQSFHLRPSMVASARAPRSCHAMEGLVEHAESQNLMNIFTLFLSQVHPDPRAKRVCMHRG